MKRFFITLLFTAILIWCRAQDTGTVYLAEKGLFDGGEGSIRSDYLYYLKGDTLKTAGADFGYVLPEQFRSGKIAWNSMYFEELMKDAGTVPYMIYLVLDYDSSTVRIVFDNNGNLYFGDDSIYVIKPDQWVKAEFKNPGDTAVKMIFPFMFSRNRDHISISKQWKGFSDGRALPYNYGMYYKNYIHRRITLPGGDVVALFDYNQNGFYNDPGDQIVTHAFWKEERPKWDFLYHGGNEIWKGRQLSYKHRVYRLIDVDKYGNSVKLELKYHLKDTIEIPSTFSFIDEGGQNTKLNSRYMKVIYVWNSNCLECPSQEPVFFDLMKKHDRVVSFYTFNSGDKPKDMLDYIEASKFPYQKNYITDKHAGMLQVTAAPVFILLYRNCVLLRTTDVRELKMLLEK